ncbi:MAG TPA: FkbM family methyltransferase [Gaiellaceae bacterium]|nr:FkbM family methyltransferase [Gaiellaceae bacterium]
MLEVARRRLKGTPVQNWRVTSALYRRYVRYLSRGLPGGSDSVRVSFRGLELEIERGDITMLPTLLSGEYEAEEIDTLSALLRQRAAFVDVGANVGVYSLLAARALESGGRVVAVEPNPDARRFLELNLQRNSGKRSVEVVPLALADVEGELPWARTRYHGTGRLASEVQGPATERVRATTLDRLVASLGLDLRNGAVKIDVEGFEPRVIEGGESTISRERPVLLVEVCGRSSAVASVAWGRAIEILAESYERVRVFGPLEPANGAVRDVLEAVVADGRQHNVLLR